MDFVIIYSRSCDISEILEFLVAPKSPNMFRNWIFLKNTLKDLLLDNSEVESTLNQNVCGRGMIFSRKISFSPLSAFWLVKEFCVIIDPLDNSTDRVLFANILMKLYLFFNLFRRKTSFLVHQEWNLEVSFRSWFRC